MYMFYVQLDIKIETGFGLFPVSVMQTYGKKEDAPVACSSFSDFIFFPVFSGVEGMLKDA